MNYEIYNSRNCLGHIDFPHIVVSILSTIVEIVWVIQTKKLYLRGIVIYNSRNCLGHIDHLCTVCSHTIYNSRNCLGHIDLHVSTSPKFIYNSRNCLGHIDYTTGGGSENDLQQQKLFGSYRHVKFTVEGEVNLQQQKLFGSYRLVLQTLSLTTSTIVEIVWVIQTTAGIIKTIRSIYNSRNCLGHIDHSVVLLFYVISTIVEIVWVIQTIA